MDEMKKAFAEGVIFIFIGVMLIPLFNTPMIVQSSTVQTNQLENFKQVSKTIWTDRLSEIYLHAIFLATTIIASVLALRKPPKVAPEQLELLGIKEKIVHIDEETQV